MDNNRNNPINNQRSSTIRPNGTTRRSTDPRSPQANDMRTFSRQEQPRQPQRPRAFGDRVAVDPRQTSSDTSRQASSQRRSPINPELYNPGDIPDFVPVSDRKPMYTTTERPQRRTSPVESSSVRSRLNQGAGEPVTPSARRTRPTTSDMPAPKTNVPSFSNTSTRTSNPRPRNTGMNSGSGDGGNHGGDALNRTSGGGRPPRKPKSKKPVWFNILKLIMIFMIAVGLIGSVGGFVYVQSVLADTQPIDPSTINDNLGENSVILDANGKVLETLQNEGVRKIIKYEEMSPNLINALVSIEDKTFWQHNGFNVVRLVGSVWQSFSKGDRIKGTSTLTQQLARNVYLVETKSTRTLERKVREAYYAVQLEKALTKEQIIAAYLNTIYLGSGANGIQAAAQAYFSKDAKDLDLVESAMLAGIPASTLYYSPMRVKEKADVTPDDVILDDSDELYTTVYNPGCEKRYAIVIRLMYENGYISKEQYEEAKNTDLVSKLKPSKPAVSDISSYFADMVKDDVMKDLMEKYGYTKNEAISVLYNKGLKIHSTVDYNMQKNLESAYEEQTKNMPKIRVTFDGNGNVISKDGSVLLYRYENIVNNNGQLVIPSSDFRQESNGDLILLKGKKLNFYPKYQDDKLIGIQAVIKSVYKGSDLSSKGIRASGTKNISNFNTYTGKDLLVPSEYKSFDANKNLVISAAFLSKNPDFYTLGSNGALLIAKDKYVISEKAIVQPQSATVVVDYHTGALKAIVGGRNVQGQKIYNRAINPRQPGSSIKPLAVYLPAIDTKKFTAGSVIDDVPTFMGPNNSRWPLNWYEGSTKYWGLQTLRESMMWSINVNAVKVAQAIGLDTSMNYLKKFGITSLVESGPSNDKNLSAMALGGMTKGISPVEMASAYGAIANLGEMNETITYTSVEDRNGQVILENTPNKTRVATAEAAFITLDMLKSTVSEGLAKTAAIFSGNTTIPVAGKTGTTSNQMDAWFVGASPYYAAAVWFGNDINIPLDQGSKVSAQFWRVAMKKMHADLPAKNFSTVDGLRTVAIDTKSGLLPSSLSKGDPRGTVRNEIFIPGTEPSSVDDVHVSVKVCKDSGKLPGPNCPESSLETRVFVKRKTPVNNPEGLSIRDWSYEAPTQTCDVHTTALKPTYKNAFISANADGTYKVIASFAVQLIDGRIVDLPIGTLIQVDKSFLLPDGTSIMPYDVSNYPDLEKLKGTLSTSGGSPPSKPNSGNTSTNPDELINELDSPNGN